MSIEIGKPAPTFTVSTDNGSVSLSDYLGQKVVIYFYPKDDTSGCTSEAHQFRDALGEFAALNCQILGVSKDSVASHQKFRAKHALTFPLASDAEGALCEAYEVWKEKSMYGKKYMGIERSTFLIDENGAVQGIWRKVKVTNHAADVLKKLAELG